MANFGPAFEFLLPHEGGFVIDDGGPTKFGISQKSYPDLDIRSLTIAEAEAIYRRDFWEPNHYGAIDDQNVASKVFDLAVNMGPEAANKLLQASAKLCGYQIACDGEVGQETVAAVNHAHSPMLMRNLVALAVARYKQIVQDHEADAKYLAGWIKRAAEVPIQPPVPDPTGEFSM